MLGTEHLEASHQKHAATIEALRGRTGFGSASPAFEVTDRKPPEFGTKGCALLNCLGRYERRLAEAAVAPCEKLGLDGYLPEEKEVAAAKRLFLGVS